MAKATRYTIISLDINLNGVVDRADMTLSLTVRTKRSISRTRYFLDAQFRFMPIEVIYLRNGPNLQSACICVNLKPCCRYSLYTCMISPEMFSMFWLLIILTVANMICRDMMLRTPIPLICKR